MQVSVSVMQCYFNFRWDYYSECLRNSASLYQKIQIALEEHSIASQWAENYKQCYEQSKEDSEQDALLLQKRAWCSYAARVATDFECRFGWSISQGDIVLSEVLSDAAESKGLKRSQRSDSIDSDIVQKIRK
jgi:hypothetical protein